MADTGAAQQVHYPAHHGDATMCCLLLLFVALRFKRFGVSNTLMNRAAWRHALLTTPGLDQYLSGVIVTEETFYQTMDLTDSGSSSSSGASDLAKPHRLVEHLINRGIAVGVKVDQGTAPLHPDTIHFPSEPQTKGLDGLLERCKQYAADGATFAKWRAVLRVDEGLGWPTEEAIELNARQLAQYASAAQAAGLVPIVEPEVMVMEGGHELGYSEAVSVRVLSAVVKALVDYGVLLEGVVLKPAMILPGSSSSSGGASNHADSSSGGDIGSGSAAEVGAATVRVLRRTIPPAIPGIAFLSGGQTEQQAAGNLAAVAKACGAVSGVICNAASDSDSLGDRGCGCPWVVTFSYGRALQTSALQAWAHNTSDVLGVQKVCVKVAAAAAAATAGSGVSAVA